MSVSELLWTIKYSTAVYSDVILETNVGLNVVNDHSLEVLILVLVSTNSLDNISTLLHEARFMVSEWVEASAKTWLGELGPQSIAVCDIFTRFGPNNSGVLLLCKQYHIRPH